MFKRLVILCALGALLPLSAFAEGVAVTSMGVRGGFSSGPDQLVLGGQLSVGDIAPNLTFDPNVELGFGDNVKVFAFNMDMHYHFEIKNSEWRPYVGAGAGINLIRFDAPPGFDDSVTKVAGELIAGTSVPTKSGHHFFGEFKLGLGDSATPDFKMLVGLDFKR
jgi:hypothetical protein